MLPVVLLFDPVADLFAEALAGGVLALTGC